MASESDNGGTRDETERISIRVFTTHEVAQVAATNLEAHDIECWVTSDDGGGMLPNFSASRGVRLLVLTSDAEAATELLDSPSSAEPDPTGPDSPPQ